MTETNENNPNVQLGNLEHLLRPIEKLDTGGDDGPQTFEEAKSLFVRTMKFMWKYAKLTRKDFIEFLGFYNEHEVELNLDPEETQALTELRGMWGKVSKTTSLEFYFAMKDHHTFLNGRFLCGNKGAQNELWQIYIANFQLWRCNSMLHHFKLMMYMKKNETATTSTATTSTTTISTTTEESTGSDSEGNNGNVDSGDAMGGGWKCLAKNFDKN